jgi:hypothetical protein
MHKLVAARDMPSKVADASSDAAGALRRVSRRNQKQSLLAHVLTRPLSLAVTRSRMYCWTATTFRSRFLRRRRSRAFRRVGGSRPRLASDQSRLPARALRQTRDGQSARDPQMCRSRLSESTRRRRPCCANRDRRNGRATLRGLVLLDDRPVCRRSTLLRRFAWGNSH